MDMGEPLQHHACSTCHPAIEFCFWLDRCRLPAVYLLILLYGPLFDTFVCFARLEAFGLLGACVS